MLVGFVVPGGFESLPSRDIIQRLFGNRDPEEGDFWEEGHSIPFFPSHHEGGKDLLILPLCIMFQGFVPSICLYPN